MAKSLSYTPPKPAHDPARAEVDDLVAALHESGLLRTVTGGVRAYPDVLRVLLQAVDADTVRSVLALSAAAGDLEPEASQRLARGVREARTAAAHAAGRRRAEGPFRLARRLLDPDTRRGLAAALAALAAVGAALGPADGR